MLAAVVHREARLVPRLHQAALMAAINHGFLHLPAMIR